MIARADNRDLSAVTEVLDKIEGAEAGAENKKAGGSHGENVEKMTERRSYIVT
jgi:hypothetical protein